MKISKSTMAAVAASLGLALIVGGCTPENQKGDSDSSSSSPTAGHTTIIPSTGHSADNGEAKASTGIGAGHGGADVGG